MTWTGWAKWSKNGKKNGKTQTNDYTNNCRLAFSQSIKKQRKKIVM